jgi:hypothetical protein
MSFGNLRSSQSYSSPNAPQRIAAHLAPELEVPRDLALRRSLVQPSHFLSIAQALREAADRQQGRLFFLSHNLHTPRSTASFAMKAAGQAVCALANSLWRQDRRNVGSFLGRQAAGTRPLCAHVVELDSHESWHVHGFLLLPPSHRQSRRWILRQLRQLPDSIHLSRGCELKASAVHLDQIHHWQPLQPYVDFACGNWYWMPLADRIVDFALHGRFVTEDWRPIMQRACELDHQQAMLHRHAEHSRAEQTRERLQQGHVARIRSAKSISSGTGNRSQKRRPFRFVEQVEKPKEAPELPRRRCRTGWTSW